MTIVLFAIIGATIKAGTGYWICFSIFLFTESNKHYSRLDKGDDIMTDHKFTDDEIKKALKCLSDSDTVCDDCAYKNFKFPKCQRKTSKDALDLINRRDAEIERLQKECEITRAYIHNNGLEWGLVSHLEFYKNQRAEATKEFAESIKKELFLIRKECIKFIECDGAFAIDKAIKKVDNLVKEMENETK